MFRKFINFWADFVVERRWLVLVASAIFALLALLPLKNLYFDNSNEMWFIKDDPALVQYDELLKSFGDNEYFLIGIEARPGDASVFTKEYIEMTYQLTEFLENHDFLKDVQFTDLTRERNGEKFQTDSLGIGGDLGGDFSGGFDQGFGEGTLNPEQPKRSHPIRAVTKVQSLTTYQVTQSKGDTLDVHDLFPESPSEFEGTPEQLAQAEALMKGETLVVGSLISQDFRHALISARATYLKGTINHHVAMVKEVKNFVKEQGFEEQGFVFHFTGNPEISANFFNSSMSDQELTLPLMFLLIIVVLVTSFRSVAGLTMPLLVIVGSVVTTMAFIAYLGWALNMLNVTLPVILMAVGIGDSVHILVEFYHHRNQGVEPKEAAKESVRHLFVPCLNTSITTGLGFLAISVSKLAPLREFGVVAAFGVAMAFLITVTLLPALMSFAKAKESQAQEDAEVGFVDRFTAKITDFDFKYAKPISIIGLVVVLASVAALSTVKVNANFVDYFKKDAPMRADLDYFNDTYQGGFFLEFILDSGKDKGVLDPQYLARAQEFQDYLESLDHTGQANSLLDILSKLNQAMHGDDPAWNKLPDSRELVAQYLLLYSNSSPTEDLTDLKTFDERRMRVSLRLVNQPTNQMKDFVQKIQTKVDQDFADLGVTITGMPVLYNNMDTYILQGIVQSFALALAAIFICFLVLLRSIKYGLLALIPSLFPILLAGGIMGLMGFYLNFSAMIIASVTFGIAVDDTIHILSRYMKVRATGVSRKEAVHVAVTETGKAITFTTVILFFGFAILMLSTFVPNIQLGFFAGVILLVALVASLTLLPAVMFLQKSKAHS
ncbi:MAG: MMPL family transporter [bacterium]|nr:MMPL family transporter [bacterium]